MPDNRQGTGKHPHKSTEESWRHTKDNQQTGKEERSEQKARSGASSSSNSDLKQREYRDEHGNIRHQTHTKRKKAA